MDFFVAPTITFGILYCFFVISHGRWRILHFNIAMSPTSSWIIQQLREAFPFEPAPRFPTFDQDAKYGPVKSLKERYRWACYSVFWERFPSAC
jgi:hypothetical protein